MAGPLQPQGRRTVSPGASGLRQVNLQAPRGAFGGTQARALQEAAEGVGDLGDVLEERADAMQERQDKAFAMEVGSRLDQFARRKEAELEQLRGKNAIGATEGVRNELNELGDQVLSKAQTGRQRQLLSRKLGQIKDSLFTKASKVEAEGSQEYFINSQEAQITQAKRRFQNIEDPTSEDLQNFTQTVASARLTVAQERGEPIQQARNEIQSTVSDGVKAQVENALENREDPILAQQRLRRFENNLLPDARNTLQKSIGEEIQSKTENIREARRQGNYAEAAKFENQLDNTPDSFASRAVTAVTSEKQNARPANVTVLTEEDRQARATFLKEAENTSDFIARVQQLRNEFDQAYQQANQSLPENKQFNVEDKIRKEITKIAEDQEGIGKTLPLLAQVSASGVNPNKVPLLQTLVQATRNPDAFRNADKFYSNQRLDQEGTGFLGFGGEELSLTEAERKPVVEKINNVASAVAGQTFRLNLASGQDGERARVKAEQLSEAIRVHGFRLLSENPQIEPDQVESALTENFEKATGNTIISRGNDTFAFPIETREDRAVAEQLKKESIRNSLKRKAVRSGAFSQITGIDNPDDISIDNIKITNTSQNQIGFQLIENGVPKGKVVDSDGDLVEIGSQEMKSAIVNKLTESTGSPSLGAVAGPTGVTGTVGPSRQSVASTDELVDFTKQVTGNDSFLVRRVEEIANDPDSTPEDVAKFMERFVFEGSDDAADQ